ncbi:hypothetical protein [Candidatus Harpocratesius sp.]
MRLKKSSKILTAFFIGFTIIFSMNYVSAYAFATEINIAYGTCSNTNTSLIEKNDGTFLIVVCKQSWGIGKIDVLIDIKQDNAQYMDYDYHFYDGSGRVMIRWKTNEGWSVWKYAQIGSWTNARLPDDVRGKNVVQIEFRKTLLGYFEFKLDFLRLK